MNWELLNKLGKNKLLATSYLWLIIVPIAAKVLATVESPLDFSPYINGLVVNISLPFSWQLFYYSSVAVSLANILYFLKCPSLVKDFNTFSDYKKEGRGAAYLLDYAKKKGIELSKEANAMCGWMKETDSMQRSVGVEEIGHYMAIGFWEIYEVEKHKSRSYQYLSLVLYILGISLILYILIENFIFVFEQSAFNGR